MDRIRVSVLTVMSVISCAGMPRAQESKIARPTPPPSNVSSSNASAVTESVAERSKRLVAAVLPKDSAPLNKKQTVWLNAKRKRVFLVTEVVLRDGLLEMLCCLKQTKEHESILSLDAKAYVVHTGLLATGATVGTPVQFTPEFRVPTGQTIDIVVHWMDRKGMVRAAKAQTWVRHATHRYFAAPLRQLPPNVTLPDESDLRFDKRNSELTWYGRMTVRQRDELLNLSDDAAFVDAVRSLFQQGQFREMQADWVFAGSGFYQDQASGKKYYQAEGGDLICVANFASATLDVALKSNATGETNLLFEPYTERVPPRGTVVVLELIPRFEQAAPPHGDN